MVLKQKSKNENPSNVHVTFARRLYLIYVLFNKVKTSYEPTFHVFNSSFIFIYFNFYAVLLGSRLWLVIKFYMHYS